MTAANVLSRKVSVAIILSKRAFFDWTRGVEGALGIFKKLILGSMFVLVALLRGVSRWRVWVPGEGGRTGG